MPDSKPDSYVKYRVLVTGFGPFGTFKDNPSWLAVKTLHDTVITTAPRGKPPKGAKAPAIHLTSLNIPTLYTAVLDTLPGLHAAPPVLPDAYTPPCSRAPPDAGFDLLVHVGVAGPGPLFAERRAHKTGYSLPDNDHQPPPLAEGADGRHGFGAPRYGADFAEELYTPIDVDGVVADLTSGLEPLVQPSDDPGHYLCDFIYYCSLAESKLAGRSTPVLFVHCPPTGQKMTAEEVADGVRRIIANVCARMVQQ
ncbi:hypothetical protein B0H10DRAFT_1786324 [Mycena sp. CBHHK59/15]|nr:hypothetical protein B0H10DRAFT_1786324 [Mycena sp. CBHHK59/15]